MDVNLKQLTIEGFQSIKVLPEFKLNRLNVLIGANGAGKSNFVDFFRLLRAMADNSLQTFAASHGEDRLFFLGPNYTRKIAIHLIFEISQSKHSQSVDHSYVFSLTPSPSGKLIVLNEHGKNFHQTNLMADGDSRSWLPFWKKGGDFIDNTAGAAIYESISKIGIYHFNDTGWQTPMRRAQSVREFDHLHEDASNIAAFLLRLKEDHHDHYDMIRDTVRQIAPFFDDFLLRPQMKGPEERVRLEWTQLGVDYAFQAFHLSDGTIRFICLAAALLQPEPPGVIVIDEPELGLHPAALATLAGMIQSASERTQVIVSTQSPTLLDWFDPEDIIVVRREDGASLFERLDREDLDQWLEDYTLGELWQKNVLRGGPERD